MTCKEEGSMNSKRTSYRHMKKPSPNHQEIGFQSLSLQKLNARSLLQYDVAATVYTIHNSLHRLSVLQFPHNK